MYPAKQSIQTQEGCCRFIKISDGAVYKRFVFAPFGPRERGWSQWIETQARFRPKHCFQQAIQTWNRLPLPAVSSQSTWVFKCCPNGHLVGVLEKEVRHWMDSRTSIVALPWTKKTGVVSPKNHKQTIEQCKTESLVYKENQEVWSYWKTRW